MAVLANFRREQRSVAIRMAVALAMTILAAAMCLHWGAAAPSSLTERLIVTARADVFVLCWLAATIGNVARLRFFCAEDIAGSRPGTASLAVGDAKAILQNTLEQVVLAIPIHVALAVLVRASLPLIIALAALFTTGRLLFWIGYAKGAQARALGFALTFYPSIAGLVIAVVAVMHLSI